LLNGALFFIFAKQTVFPPKIIGLTTFIVVTSLLLEKTFMYFIAGMARKSYERKRVIIIGTGKEARKFINSVVRNKYTGIEIVGLVSKELYNPNQKILNHSIIGSINNIESIIREYNPEEVIIAIQTTNFKVIQQIFESCAEVGVQLRVISDFFSAMTKNLQIDTVHGINFISFYPYHRSDFDKLLKRLLDVSLSLVGIIILSPILILISLMIIIKDGKPILFSWKVVGYNRKPIKSWKFRTMVNNADELKKKLLQKK
jgi:hypothetical protein